MTIEKIKQEAEKRARYLGGINHTRKLAFEAGAIFGVNATVEEIIKSINAPPITNYSQLRIAQDMIKYLESLKINP